MISNKFLRKTLWRYDLLHSDFQQVLQQSPEQLYSKRICLAGFMSNALTSGISWQNTHFSILTVARFLWTQSIILGFHFILVPSITVTWSSSFSGLRFKLEIPYSPEKLSKLARKYLFCFQQKVFRVFIFPYFVLLWYVLVPSLLKTFPKRIYISLFLLPGGI